jgi:branched-chain amino acid aminotransferase
MELNLNRADHKVISTPTYGEVAPMKLVEIKKCKPQPSLKEQLNPAFGSVFAPHMLKATIQSPSAKGYTGEIHAEILPFGTEDLTPATSALHYAQTIFEGMKAYRHENGDVVIFRPDIHAARFTRSASRMVMPALPEEIFRQCLREYVRFESESVPHGKDQALYLRPFMYASDKRIKLGSYDNFSFYIIASLAGNYFGNGQEFKPAKVLVNPHFVRAFRGGTGEIKAGANYAMSLWPMSHASKLGCDQVLYLNGENPKVIDEFGGMNFFAIIGNELVTPNLNGCILPGVTRQSLLEIASEVNLKPVERPIEISEVLKGIKSGSIKEVFACGTAAVVSPLGEILWQNEIGGSVESYKLNERPNKALELRKVLTEIQSGQRPDTRNWLEKV